MANERSDKRSSERVANQQEVDEELIDELQAPAVASGPRGEQQGISHRAAIEEEREQRKLPPRGEAKDDVSKARR
jgi:hypothetical protein